MNVRRPWALSLVPLYRAGLAWQKALRAAGLRRPHHLQWPVVSVGSLSAGGAGKTPVTIALANLLHERGWSVDVLSRGYGRASRGVQPVNLLAADPAREFGDEPTLIARRTGLPVWVGSDRFAAGQAAEGSRPWTEPKLRQGDNRQDLTQQPDHDGVELALSFVGDSPHSDPNQGPDPDPDPAAVAFVISSLQTEAEDAAELVPRVHILDDGLQHRRLHRSFDLVLVTAEDLTDRLLPAGNLREPFSALRRADAVVLREEEVGRLAKPLRRLLGPEVPLWTVRRSLRFPAPLGVFGAGLRPLAFCGIARPENFAAMLSGAGCGIIDTVVFPDHHRYAERDLQELIRLGKEMNASGFVTTEKDVVKLDVAAVARLEREVGPLLVPVLDAAFVYESPVVRALSSCLQSPAPARPVGNQDEVRSR